MSTRPLPSESTLAQLSTHGVPIETLADACRSCSAECSDDDDDDDAADAYPRGFDVDLETDMLGSFKGFGRQVVISTGKADWDREVTDERDSLAQLVRDQYAERSAAAAASSTSTKPSFLDKLARKFSSSVTLDSSSTTTTTGPAPPGVHPSSAQAGPGRTAESPSSLSILNSSFVSSSHEHDKESVMVFPDYKVVHDVEANARDAAELVERYLASENGRAGRRPAEVEGSRLKSWPLPYRAVILLCSHKKRDKRCSIAAPLLANQFHHHLARHDLDVDVSGQDLESGPAIEDFEPSVTTTERANLDDDDDDDDDDDSDKDEAEGGLETALRATLERTSATSDRVGVFLVSHIGGHRYAGNVVIHFPNGSALYYGRVTPADVGVIVDRTIMQGKVIPEFLRGGLGIDGKRGARGILDW
ncbi:hypothetical protein JCM11491_000735 [Sporobolomyces phaffii]